MFEMNCDIFSNWDLRFETAGKVSLSLYEAFQCVGQLVGYCPDEFVGREVLTGLQTAACDRNLSPATLYSCQNTEIPQRWCVRREREKTSERGVFSTFWGLLEENMDTFCAFSELRHGRTAGLVMSYFICLSEILIVCRYYPLSQISNLN